MAVAMETYRKEPVMLARNQRGSGRRTKHQPGRWVLGRQLNHHRGAWALAVVRDSLGGTDGGERNPGGPHILSGRPR
jgi:hypothetical protein